MIYDKGNFKDNNRKKNCKKKIIYVCNNCAYGNIDNNNTKSVEAMKYSLTEPFHYKHTQNKKYTQLTFARDHIAT